MKKIILLNILTCLFLFVNPQNSQYPEWTTFLSNSSITDIADAGEYLWLTTSEEVIKFEKTTGTAEYFTLDSLGLDTENSISKIACDKNGLPYVGTKNGGLLKLVEDKWILMRPEYLEELYTPMIVDIVIGEDDTIWAACNNGLMQYVGDSITVYTKENSEIDGGITSLAKDHEGNLWLGITYYSHNIVGGLLKFDGRNWTIYKSSKITHSFSFAPIRSDKKGKLWMGAFPGLDWGIIFTKLVSFDGFNWVTYDLPDHVSIITSLEIEDDSIVWAGSAVDSIGLMRYADSVWKLYKTTNSGLPSNNIRSVLIDENGTLWAGTEKGLAAYNKSDITKVIDKNSEFKIEIHPNPVNKILNIKVPSKTYNFTIEIYNLHGKRLKLENYDSNDNQIDVSNLSNGIYIATIKSEQFNWTGKFVKQ